MQDIVLQVAQLRVYNNNASTNNVLQPAFLLKLKECVLVHEAYLIKQLHIRSSLGEFLKTGYVMDWIHASLDCDAAGIST